MRQRNAMGIRIRELRKASRLSSTALAAAAGIAPSHLSQIERGESRPSFTVASRIAAALGTTLADLAAVERDQAATDAALVAALLAHGVGPTLAEEIRATLPTRSRVALLEAMRA
jgi:transcriptional regulator with XRE-family HTH domain